MEASARRFDMKVAARRTLTPEIDEFTLSSANGEELPGFSPGAHITVQTPSGAMRRYSLVNEGDAPETYVIAVKREPDSRGGSASMHDDAKEGTVLCVEEPENEFELVDAPNYLLIAGGIGITPILAMARHLSSVGKPFELIYLTRSAPDTAYIDDLQRFAKVTIHHDEGAADNFFDFWDLLEKPGKGHVYCCGPAGLMEEIRALTGHWPDKSVHFEDFNPVSVVREDDLAFQVTLSRSGRAIDVPADRSILEALRDAGIGTISSCESGTCGTCKCRVIEGEVDHRDHVLLEEEKSDFIMICVSRAKGGALVLDL